MANQEEDVDYLFDFEGFERDQQKKGSPEFATQEENEEVRSVSNAAADENGAEEEVRSVVPSSLAGSSSVSVIGASDPTEEENHEEEIPDSVPNSAHEISENGAEEEVKRNKGKRKMAEEDVEVQQPPVREENLGETSQLEVEAKARRAEEDVKRREEKRIDGLPTELCVEVFSWLPLQDFVRSRCIAKWVKTELLQPNVWKTRPLLMVDAFSIDEEITSGLFGVPQLSKEAGWFKLPQPPKGQMFQDFVGSSRGLLCVLIFSADSIDDFIQDSLQFSMYNPTSSESVILPRLTLEQPVIMYGFGESRGEERELKLAVFTNFDQAILTLGTTQWRVSERSVQDDDQENDAMDRPLDGVCMEGNLYWLRSSGILKFCLQEENMERVYTPKGAVAIGSWVDKLAVVVGRRIYTLESNAEWKLNRAVRIQCCVNSRTRFTRLAEKLVVVHRGKLGFVEHGSNVIWCTAQGARVIHSAIVIEPTFNRLCETVNWYDRFVKEAEQDDQKDIENDSEHEADLIQGADEGHDEYLDGEDSEHDGTVDDEDSEHGTVDDEGRDEQLEAED